jgi:Protein of unknown function (DUF1592)/Protein of unknown function (DUF1588)/Protein of unknown function (DUF1587)/Protein of unknown function (DUF1585)/Protein of unknown function (DUF1595)
MMRASSGMATLSSSAGSLLLGALCAGGAALLSVAAVAESSPTPAAAMPVAAQRELIDRYCMKCHNFTDYAGGIEFEVFDPGSAYEDAPVAEKMLRKLRAGMMPPAGKPRPDFATMQAFATMLENTIDSQEKASLRVPRLHRLNRTEYANAVRDLLALELDSTQFLPPDDASRGFDNQAGTLTLSPALLEAYLSAASRISRVAVGTPAAPTQVTYRVAEDTTQNYQVEGLPFGTRGGLAIDHTFPSDGKYTLKVFSVNLGNMGNFRPFGEVRGEQLLIYIDGERIAQVDWDKALNVGRRFDEEGGGQLMTIDVTLPVQAGRHHIGVTFLATNYAPGLDLNHAFDRSTIETGGLPGFTFYPHIGSVRIDGPTDATAATASASRARIFTCQPAQASEEERCAREISSVLARRAYRGYATSKHVDTLMEFYSLGRRKGSFDDGIEAIVQRVLADPQFVYRLESTPPKLAPGTAYTIANLDLASRLSFFLWSSIPDDTLLQLADSGQLSQPDVLRQQVRRMLADPRASALTNNFAGQWLGLRNLAGHAPVVDQFPDFDDNLRQAFRREVEMLFGSLLAEDRSVLDLLTADYTFVNERLARHYGIAGIRGSDFRRVKLDASQSARWGLLGKGEFLTVSSQPGRTSPVIRGNWVLKNILGVPAPDPPPDVPALKAKPADAAGNAKPPSMREQMVQHRSDPKCQGCHKLMDPIGFALEPFDAIGRWRTVDGDTPIDASGEMYDGTPVDGPAGVREFLVKYQAQYVRNVAQNLLTYALGRGVEYDDMPTVRGILHATASDGYKLSGLIEAVAMSDVFRMNVAPEGGDQEGTSPPLQSAGGSSSAAVVRANPPSSGGG